VREYYYAWPDGREAAGFVLSGHRYVPVSRNLAGWFASPALGRALRLAPAGLRAR
jgi:hypothetical protein